MKLLLIFILSLIILFGMAWYSSLLMKRICLSLDFDLKRNWIKVTSIGALFVVILILSNFLNIFILFLAHVVGISIIVDLLYLVFKNKIKKEKLIRIYNLTILPLALAVLILVYGAFNIQNIVETKYVIDTKKDIEPIKILFLADLHYGDIFQKENLDKVKSTLDNVNADVVILGGDIVEEATSKEEMKYIFKVLGDIQNNDGIYFVYGNHDNQNYSSLPRYTRAELNESIKGNRITILKDEYIELENNIVIAGRENYDFNRKSVNNILSGDFDDKYVIMVDHQPVEYKENVENDVDLILSGHTHAGQIFPGNLFINIFKTSDLYYGHKKYENMDAIVTSGLAGWGYPIRTSKYSEYVVIEVK